MSPSEKRAMITGFALAWDALPDETPEEIGDAIVLAAFRHSPTLTRASFGHREVDVDTIVKSHRRKHAGAK